MPNQTIANLAAELLAGEIAAFDVTAESQPYRDWRAWILEHGTAYPPTGADPTRGPRNECYANALNTVRSDPALTYVEGLATDERLPGFMFCHAWCVDPDGQTIETTWHDGAESYFGVAIPQRDLAMSVIAASIAKTSPLMEHYCNLAGITGDINRHRAARLLCKQCGAAYDAAGQPHKCGSAR